MTITLVASCLVRGRSLEEVIKACCWDRVRFYQQLAINQAKVDARKAVVSKMRGL